MAGDRAFAGKGVWRHRLMKPALLWLIWFLALVWFLSHLPGRDRLPIALLGLLPLLWIVLDTWPGNRWAVSSRYREDGESGRSRIDRSSLSGSLHPSLNLRTKVP